MLNQVILVGRIASEFTTKEEDGKKIATVTVAIPRSFKNMNGEYETDFVDIRLFNDVATNTKEYCRKGDIIGVKGRIQSEKIVDTEMQEIYDSVRKQVKDSKNAKKQEEKIKLLTEISSLMTKYKTTVIAERVTFLSSKKDGE